MKRIIGKSSFIWLAGVSLACALSLSSCSTGTDAGETNVEEAGAKDFTDPAEANRTQPDTASAEDQQEGVKHYEQTYGGAQEPPSNPDVDMSTPQKPVESR